MSATRRTLLAGLALPLAATACHPIVPAVIPRHAAAGQPDAELLALGRRFAEAMTLRRAAFDRLVEAEDRLTIPDQPAAIIATNFDIMDDFPRPEMRHDVRGWTWTPHQFEKIRSAPPRRAYILPGGSQVCERTARRKAEILAAYDAYRAEVRAAEDASGQTMAEADYNAAADVVNELAGLILMTSATTLEGLAVKARIPVELFGAVQPVHADDASSANVLRSILADVLAMGGTA